MWRGRQDGYRADHPGQMYRYVLRQAVHAGVVVQRLAALVLVGKVSDRPVKPLNWAQPDTGVPVGSRMRRGLPALGLAFA